MQYRRSRRACALPKPLRLPALLAVIVGLLLLVRALLPAPVAEVEPPPPGTPPWAQQALIPVNPYSRPGDKLEGVTGIVIHYTGNPGTSAQQNRDYFAGLADSGESYVSSNFIVGLEGEVLQCVPSDEVAYASGARNIDTLSIEVCHPDAEGQFTPETTASLVKLVRWLADYYALEGEQIIRHYDVMGKECPLYYVRHEDAWTDLLDQIDRAERTTP